MSNQQSMTNQIFGQKIPPDLYNRQQERIQNYNNFNEQQQQYLSPDKQYRPQQPLLQGSNNNPLKKLGKYLSDDNLNKQDVRLLEPDLSYKKGYIQKRREREYPIYDPIQDPYYDPLYEPIYDPLIEPIYGPIYEPEYILPYQNTQREYIPVIYDDYPQPLYSLVEEAYRPYYYPPSPQYYEQFDERPRVKLVRKKKKKVKKVQKQQIQENFSKKGENILVNFQESISRKEGSQRMPSQENIPRNEGTQRRPSYQNISRKDGTQRRSSRENISRKDVTQRISQKQGIQRVVEYENKFVAGYKKQEKELTVNNEIQLSNKSGLSQPQLQESFQFEEENSKTKRQGKKRDKRIKSITTDKSDYKKTEVLPKEDENVNVRQNNLQIDNIYVEQTPNFQDLSQKKIEKQMRLTATFKQNSIQNEQNPQQQPILYPQQQVIYVISPGIQPNVQYPQQQPIQYPQQRAIFPGIQPYVQYPQQQSIQYSQQQYSQQRPVQYHQQRVSSIQPNLNLQQLQHPINNNTQRSVIPQNRQQPPSQYQRGQNKYIEYDLDFNLDFKKQSEENRLITSTQLGVTLPSKLLLPTSQQQQQNQINERLLQPFDQQNMINGQNFVSQDAFNIAQQNMQQDSLDAQQRMQNRIDSGNSNQNNEIQKVVGDISDKLNENTKDIQKVIEKTANKLNDIAHHIFQN